jgi:hypothetical protein
MRVPLLKLLTPRKKTYIHSLSSRQVRSWCPGVWTKFNHNRKENPKMAGAIKGAQPKKKKGKKKAAKKKATKK